MTCWSPRRRCWRRTWVTKIQAAPAPGAAFAFPLSIGRSGPGVMGLYRGSPGPLPGAQLGDAFILADAATLLLDGLRPVSPDHA
jgi:hypothetical protein